MSLELRVGPELGLGSGRVRATVRARVRKVCFRCVCVKIGQLPIGRGCVGEGDAVGGVVAVYM